MAKASVAKQLEMLGGLQAEAVSCSDLLTGMDSIFLSSSEHNEPSTGKAMSSFWEVASSCEFAVPHQGLFAVVVKDYYLNFSGGGGAQRFDVMLCCSVESAQVEAVRARKHAKVILSVAQDSFYRNAVAFPVRSKQLLRSVSAFQLAQLGWSPMVATSYWDFLSQAEGAKAEQGKDQSGGSDRERARLR